jgi:RNA polymerase sigma-70 factor (ECF subfamily)
MGEGIHEDLIATVPNLRAFAHTLCGNPDLADDLVQDTIVRALTASSQFTPGTNFKAWTFTILRNLYVNHLRRNRLRPIAVEDEILCQYAVPARQEVNLELDDFRRALMQLPVEQREVLVLVGASGFSYEEAAAVCNCAVGTIKSRLSRARRQILDVLMGAEVDDRLKLPPRTAEAPAEGVVGRAKAEDDVFGALA